MFKKILKSAPFRALLCPLITAYIRLVGRSGRWRRETHPETAALLAAGAPVILAFWHGRLMMVPAAWARRASLKVIISNHRDGDLIARSVAPLGVGAIRGSGGQAKPGGGKGGVAAFRAALRELKAGGSVGVAPDGPRGPRRRAADGVARLALISGAPIVPFAFSAARAREMPSWDRFLLAAPFTKGVFVWGAPIRAPKDKENDCDAEALRAQLEKSLNEISAAADRAMGRLLDEASENNGGAQKLETPA